MINSEINIPIFYGNADGNSFLIFDCINYQGSQEVLYAFVRNFHKQYSYDKVDTCLIVNLEGLNDLHMDVNLYLVEKDFEGANSFCGNGCRILAHYLYENYLDYSSFSVVYNEHIIPLIKNKEKFGVCLNKDYFFDKQQVFYTQSSNMFLLPEYNLSFFYNYIFEPHLITFVALSEKEITEIGNYIQEKYTMYFPFGVHVNTVSLSRYNELTILTYEKGARRTTKACRTGSITAVHKAKQLQMLDNTLIDIQVKSTGGTIHVQEINNLFYLYGTTCIERVIELTQ